MVFWCLWFPPKNERTNSTLLLWFLISNSFFGVNQRHQKTFQNQWTFNIPAFVCFCLLKIDSWNFSNLLMLDFVHKVRFFAKIYFLSKFRKNDGASKLKYSSSKKVRLIVQKGATSAEIYWSTLMIRNDII